MSSELPRSDQGGNNAPLGKTKRSRSWVFTDFKVPAPQLLAGMSYLLYAPEICPETKKEHWQGYVYFKDTKTTSAVSKILGNVWCNNAEGDIETQLTYIRGPYDKDGKYKPFNPE